MYSITAQQYQKLEPYIQIPDKQAYSNIQNNNQNFDNKTKPTKATILIDLNEADSLALTTVRGIGPSFASRIIKYRNRLGGFVSINQLKEVYGIDSIKYVQISPQLKIASSIIKQININTSTFDDLKNFPYLTYKQMNAIIAYRKQHGPLKDFETLQQIQLLDQVAWKRLKPYLSFVVLDNK